MSRVLRHKLLPLPAAYGKAAPTTGRPVLSWEVEASVIETGGGVRRYGELMNWRQAVIGREERAEVVHSPAVLAPRCWLLACVVVYKVHTILIVVLRRACVFPRLLLGHYAYCLSDFHVVGNIYTHPLRVYLVKVLDASSVLRLDRCCDWH